jgi:hypothetical protein
MRKKGKFLLFDHAAEFAPWLRDQDVARRVVLVQNHHTWLPSYRTFQRDNHFALLESMERSHLERGFDQIGQNLTTFPDGRLAVGRPLDRIPAGIKGANTGGVCLEHVGNFDRGGDLMAPAHRETIVTLNALLCRKFSLKPGTDTIVYHHWWDLTTGRRTDGAGSAKSCPGTAFFGGNGVADAAAHFIPLIEAALAGPGAAPAATAPERVLVVTANALRGRAAPSAGAPVVKQLARGIQVGVFEESGDWRRIHPAGQQWVHARYLEALT